MASIPESPGVRVAPTTQVGRSAPTIAQTQILPQAITGLGQTLQQVGAQQIKLQQERELLEQKRKEAFQAAIVNDYKTQLERIDNNIKLKKDEVPPLPSDILGMKDSLLKERSAAIKSLLAKEKDPQVLNLINRHIESSGVDLEFDIDKTRRKKEVEYGRNTIVNSLNNVKDQLDSGLMTPEDMVKADSRVKEILESGLKSGYIDFGFIEDFEKEQKAFRKERAEELKKSEIFNKVIQGNILLDPSNKEHRNIINDNFDRILTQGGDPREAAKQLTVNTGIMPDALKTQISATLFNGSPLQKVETVGFVKDLTEENPRLIENFNSSEIALINGIQQRVDIGLSPQQAVTFTQEDIAKNKSMERSAREDLFTREFAISKKELNKNLDKFVDDLADEADTLFSREPEVPEVIRNQYSSLVRDFFLNEGVDLETAQKSAKDKIMAEWGVTEVGKKRFQKFAPEKLYKRPGVKNDWIKNQLLQEVRKTIIEDISSEELNKQLSVEINPDTIDAEMPSYLVYRENELGAVDLVLDHKNQPLVFIPDFTKTEQFKKTQKEFSSLNIRDIEKKRIQQIRESEKRAKEVINRGIFAGAIFKSRLEE